MGVEAEVAPGTRRADRTDGAVHEDRDGWLFLVGGTNRVRDQFRGGPAAWWRRLRWRLLMRRRAARCRRLGIRYLHVVVPEKVTVYADLFPALRIDWRRSPAHRLCPAEGLVDLVGPLRARREGPDLYFRTDTHWTFAGCEIAYRAICQACGIVPREDLGGRHFVETWMVRDLGDKLDPPRTELFRSYTLQEDAQRVRANPLLAAYEEAGRIEELHVGAEAVYRNPRAPSPLRILLFGDSCSHFAPLMLTGMLAETVAELHFVWSSSLDWTLIERVKPDVLLYEMAERFMARVPGDRFDLDAFAAGKLAAFSADARRRAG